MKAYQELLQDILNNGREKESGRANMPNTFGLSRGTILMKDVQNNFPLLTTKKMFWKGIVHELLWFLRGETNIKYLVDSKANIWNGDAYRWYLKKREEVLISYQVENPDDVGLDIEMPYTMEIFIELIKKGELWQTIAIHNQTYDSLGDLGKVYGYQWRNQNGVDQIADIINDLKTNPYGRYKILDAWNKKDFPEMALPPCHLMYQFIVRPMTFEERKNLIPPIPNIYSHADLDAINVPKYYLDINMYQRSCDTFLGVPFNLASMSLLLQIIAKTVGMIAGDAFWIGGDTHIYVDHKDVVEEQITREPMALPKLIINKKLESLDDILELTIDDFELVGYESHGKLSAELFTGLNKSESCTKN